MGRNKNSEISAALFKKIEPLLPAFAPTAKGGRPRVMALNGILFVLRTGIGGVFVSRSKCSLERATLSALPHP